MKASPLGWGIMSQNRNQVNFKSAALYWIYEGKAVTAKLLLWLVLLQRWRHCFCCDHGVQLCGFMNASFFLFSLFLYIYLMKCHFVHLTCIFCTLNWNRLVLKISSQKLELKKIHDKCFNNSELFKLFTLLQYSVCFCAHMWCWI